MNPGDFRRLCGWDAWSNRAALDFIEAVRRGVLGA